MVLSRRSILLAPVLAKYPFRLGVASGDPWPDSVVLWTRLAPAWEEPGGGLPKRDIAVKWELYADDAGRKPVRNGLAYAEAARAHSAHAEVFGLEAGRDYWYRFTALGHQSPLGHTRTAAKNPSQLRFAYASCQKYEDGFFTAYEHMAKDDLDLVLFLGDYIYEGVGKPDHPRQHPSHEAVTLDQYRYRYSLYKSDPLLQTAHARFPWSVIWDDHEVGNDYANLTPGDQFPAAEFAARRWAGYQAFYEHMPLRKASLPTRQETRIYRRLSFGQLANLYLLDTRQYRDAETKRQMLGIAQRDWFFAGLKEDQTRWNLIAQQIPYSKIDKGTGVIPDKWDGYPEARRELTEFIVASRLSNAVILTGDNHSHWVFDVKRDFADPGSATVATEFLGTSITSTGDGLDQRADYAKRLPFNPHVKYFNSRRGYVRCRLTAERLETDMITMPYVSRPGAPASVGARFVVEAGRPGAVRG